MAWTVILLAEVVDWYETRALRDPESAELVEAAINLLGVHGPSLGRPAVDRLTGSSVHTLKELRPGSSGRTDIRILFVFDPDRQAILLVAGDKAGQWSDWYRENIPVAERHYANWLAGEYGAERG